MLGCFNPKQGMVYLKNVRTVGFVHFWPKLGQCTAFFRVYELSWETTMLRVFSYVLEHAPHQTIKVDQRSSHQPENGRMKWSEAPREIFHSPPFPWEPREAFQLHYSWVFFFLFSVDVTLKSIQLMGLLPTKSHQKRQYRAIQLEGCFYIPLLRHIALLLWNVNTEVYESLEMLHNVVECISQLYLINTRITIIIIIIYF